MSEKTITKIVCESVKHTRFPKEDHLPNWERQDNKVTKGDRVGVLNVFFKICFIN
jgi:hypothetical protein